MDRMGRFEHTKIAAAFYRLFGFHCHWHRHWPAQHRLDFYAAGFWGFAGFAGHSANGGHAGRLDGGFYERRADWSTDDGAGAGRRHGFRRRGPAGLCDGAGLDCPAGGGLCGQHRQRRDRRWLQQLRLVALRRQSDELASCLLGHRADYCADSRHRFGFEPVARLAVKLCHQRPAGLGAGADDSADAAAVVYQENRARAA